MKNTSNICKKIKQMSDFVLNKQSNQKVKKATLNESARKRQISFIKPFLMLMVLNAFIILSVKNDNLFLNELLISVGILMLVFVVHVLSQNEAKRNNLN